MVSAEPTVRTWGPNSVPMTLETKESTAWFEPAVHITRTSGRTPARMAHAIVVDFPVPGGPWTNSRGAEKEARAAL